MPRVNTREPSLRTRLPRLASTTPQATFLAKLQAEFDFTLESGVGTKVPFLSRYTRATQGGYLQSWEHERVLCAPPPFSAADWVAKAVAEVGRGNCPMAVLILPVRVLTSSMWAHLVEPSRDYRDPRSAFSVETRFVEGNMPLVRRDLDDAGRVVETPSGYAAMFLAIFRKRSEEEKKEWLLPDEGGPLAPNVLPLRAIHTVVHKKPVAAPTNYFPYVKLRAQESKHSVAVGEFVQTEAERTAAAAKAEEVPAVVHASPPEPPKTSYLEKLTVDAPERGLEIPDDLDDPSETEEGPW